VKIKTISVQRVKNLGNYQAERLEMMAELSENENPDIAVIALRETVKELLNSTIPSERDTERPF